MGAVEGGLLRVDLPVGLHVGRLCQLRTVVLVLPKRSSVWCDS